MNLPQVIIDTHCHGRDLDQSYKTTILQVMKEASRGLIDVSMFMPNTLPAINMLKLGVIIKIILEAKMTLGSQFDQYVYFGATDNNLRECDKALESPLVVGIKVYPQANDGQPVTTGTIGVRKDQTILEVIKKVKKTQQDRKLSL